MSCVFLSLCLKFQPISESFVPAVRKEGSTGAKHKERNTQDFRSVFQFISRYSPEFRVLILNLCNSIQTLIWLPVIEHVYSRASRAAFQ